MRRRRRLILGLVLALLAGAAGLAGLDGPQGSARHDLVGPATVVDADTLVVSGQRVRLDAADAPELRQSCERGGVSWPCGRDAAQALRQFIGTRDLRCETHGRDRFDRVLALCRAGGEDIAAWLVSEGLAVAYTRYSWRYLPQEAAARWHGRGMWGGDFDRPEDWRRAHPR
ncbi:nuclease [Falsiroseomonas bella]|uniref:Nuclease n=1 Tax=Falsiroseomonas bella TaxID=2184016 RepID=A0A317FAM5_9PROT|nr:thermonuclease family protein [Falsiroseomonas bella]PWS35855.1 nuclease [Falsiroseomonas bella]